MIVLPNFNMKIYPLELQASQTCYKTNNFELLGCFRVRSYVGMTKAPTWLRFGFKLHRRPPSMRRAATRTLLGPSLPPKTAQHASKSAPYPPHGRPRSPKRCPRVRNGRLGRSPGHPRTALEPKLPILLPAWQPMIML